MATAPLAGPLAACLQPVAGLPPPDLSLPALEPVKNRETYRVRPEDELEEVRLLGLLYDGCCCCSCVMVLMHVPTSMVVDTDSSGCIMRPGLAVCWTVWQGHTPACSCVLDCPATEQELAVE